MHFKRFAISLFAIIIILTTILSSGVEAFASSRITYDYSNPATLNNKTITSDVLLERYLSEEISAEEKNYLAEYGHITVKYDDSISTGNVACEYKNGSLTVNATSYSYVTSDGKTVSWVPVSANVGGREVSLIKNDTYYSATLDGITEDDSLSADVKFVLDITVTREDIAAIINQAYSDAPEWDRRITEYREEYERLLAEYNEGVIKYTEYLEALAKYEVDIVVYNDYLVRKKIYDDAKLEYDKYLVEYSKYSEALDNYNSYATELENYNKAYSEYISYLNALAKYEADIILYEKKTVALEKIRKQLSVVDLAFVKMTDNRDVYSAIMGSLVDEVVANKDAFTSPNIGAKAEVIDAAGESTEKLRALLKGYFALKTEEEKYTYYALNFEQIRDNFVQLAKALDQLYSTKRIRLLIEKEEKDRKYRILVAQLVLISNALSGEEISSFYSEYRLGMSYKPAGQNETLLSILENKKYIEDTVDPIPDAMGYPILGAPPVLPEEKTEPTPPTPVKVPVAPDEVADPGDAPIVVEEPVLPDEVIEPIKPNEYITPETLQSLVKAYRDEKIVLRDEPREDFVFEIAKTVKKKLFNVEEAVVVFLSDDGDELYRTVIDVGSCATFVGKLPTRPEDPYATYTFMGWGSADGDVYDITSVGGDLILYPVFKTNIKSYTIEFRIDGESIKMSLPYGSVPELGFIPTKPDSATKMYSFKSWSTDIVPVRGNAVYTAIFSEEYIVPLGNNGAEISIANGVYTVDCTKATKPYFELSSLIDRAVKDRSSIHLKSIFCEIEIPYLTLILMQNSDSTVVSVETVQLGNVGYTYLVSISNADGELFSEECKISVSLPCRITDLSRHVLFVTDTDGVRSRIRYSEDDGKLLFTIPVNKTCTLLPEYSINIIASEAGSINSSTFFAIEGDRVLLSASMLDGYRFLGLSVYGRESDAVLFDGDGFIMPAFDVSVVLLWEEITYKITFKDGNRVLAELVCKQGEIPKPPSTVKKLDDFEFSYTFKGWSNDIAPAHSDAVYYAVFDSVPLPPKVEPSGLQISPRVMKLLIALAVAICMFITVVIPSVTILVCLLVRDGKLRVKRRKK